MSERSILANAVATAGTSAEVDVQDKGMVAVQLKGTNSYAGVVTFQGKLMEGDNWVSIAGVDASDLTTKSATSTNPTNKIFYIPVRGLIYFRLSYTRAAGELTATVTTNGGAFGF